MITLQNVYSTSGAKDFLYEMLKERAKESDVNISHRGTPSWGAHIEFVDSFPYRVWYLINYAELGARNEWAGQVYATKRNEVGVMIRPQFRRMGMARSALESMMAMHNPLPPIPAERAGDWVANVNPKNEASITLFTKLGFGHFQNSYSRAQLREGKHG